LFRKLRRFLTDRTWRETRWFYRVRPRDLLQPSNVTFPDRYPNVFAFVQRELGAETQGALLSFGCSTGEEVFSLRNYFPRATLKGIDINPGNIRICNRRLKQRGDPKVTFETAGSLAAEPPASYDAIFCMAVLRHGAISRPGVRSAEPFLSFQMFCRTIDSLARCLKPGGLLAIAHSNFRLCDAPAGAHFAAVMSVTDAESPSPIFGPDNIVMPGVVQADVVFRKVSPPAQ